MRDAFINNKTEEEKQLFAQELAVNIDRIVDEYSNQMSARLREIYQQLLQELKQEQNVWQSTWETAFSQREDKHDETPWHDLIKQASSLKQNILTTLS